MAVGFKEWEVICGAMGRGEQSLILRKGGIAEGRDGFQFQHPEFYFFPTLFHEQAEKVRPEFAEGFEAPPAGADAQREEIEVELFGRIDFHRIIENWEEAVTLEPFHAWREEEIRKRFEWDDAPGISLAFVRVYRLQSPWRFPNAKAYGGCRSWVKLPEPPSEEAMEPVLDDAAHAAAREKVLATLGESLSPR